MSINKLNSAIEKSEKYLEALKMVKEVTDMEAKNVYDLALQKYILLEGTAPAAQYLNEMGYRTKGAWGDRKYISTDITKMIENESIYDQVNPRILFLALKLRKGSAYSSRMDKLIKISSGYFEKFGN